MKLLEIPREMKRRMSIWEWYEGGQLVGCKKIWEGLLMGGASLPHIDADADEKEDEKVSWWEVPSSFPVLDPDHQHQHEKEDEEEDEKEYDGRCLPHLDPWQHPIHTSSIAAGEEELKSHFLFISLLMFGWDDIDWPKIVQNQINFEEDKKDASGKT